MTQRQRMQAIYEDLLKKIRLEEPLTEADAKNLTSYTEWMHKRIEKAYDQGFKDGQKGNPQIQEYLNSKKQS